MKYPRAVVQSLPDSSFFINVPLVDKEMGDFNRELSGLFRKKGERARKIIKNDMPLLSVLTRLNRDEIEAVSNETVKKIIRRRKENR